MDKNARTTGLRDIELADAVANELWILRGDGAPHRVPGRSAARPQRRSAGAPAEERLLSLLDEVRREMGEELAAAHETLAAPGQSAGRCPCSRVHSRYRAVTYHLELLPDDQAHAVIDTCRTHLARLLPVLASARGVPALPCPNMHPAPQPERTAARADAEVRPSALPRPRFRYEGIPPKTVVPEFMLADKTRGSFVCVHPACYLPPGTRRRFSLEELLPDGPETELTVKELELLWGIAGRAIRFEMSRADRRPPIRGSRFTGSRTAPTFRLCDILEIPGITLRIGRSTGSRDPNTSP
ncbi:hypothetical protein [Catenulispora pinisilvae]|uniref:hypothetical protein n=1 Tax=Catenulispora pinisilvae TaxID=2705253 RepID=UPI001890FCB4|nr:hypothetical protein [Catenulispora pinisilvae]